MSNLFKDAKRVVALKLNSKNDLIKETKQNVNLKSIDPNNLGDGVYAISKGLGWILPDENPSSIISTLIVSSGTTGTISETKEISTSITTSITGSAGFTTEFVTSSIEVSFSIEVTNSNSIAVSLEKECPDDKKMFWKVYATFARYDVIVVKNKQITDQSSVYIPKGYYEKVLIVNQDETLDQSSLVQDKAECVIGESEIIKEIVDKTAIRVPNDGWSMLPLNDSMINNLFVLNTNPVQLGKVINIFFLVQEAGNYLIQSMMNTNMTLYKVDTVNSSVITRVCDLKGEDGVTSELVEDLETTPYMLKIKANIESADAYSHVVTFFKVN